MLTILHQAVPTERKYFRDLIQYCKQLTFLASLSISLRPTNWLNGYMLTRKRFSHFYSQAGVHECMHCCMHALFFLHVCIKTH